MIENQAHRPIDIVIPWVDSTDPEWIKSRNECAVREKISSMIDNSDARFRDWDILKYLFRGIDQFMPWVRTVFFITCGHLPQWMNPGANRLQIVNHRDYIPTEYLPTFSSHTIELNMHRIPGLSEQFIYFNDDILLLNEMKEDDFFRNGLPRDYAIATPLISGHRYSVADTMLTDIEIINDHFNKNRQIKKNLNKWFHPIYGKRLMSTILMMPWKKFSNLNGGHICNSFLRDTFETVWEKEYQVLHSTCLHKFRTRRDVNQWLMRYWQLAEGTFVPVSPKRGRYFYLKNDNSELFNTLRKKAVKIICVNDNDAETIFDIEACQKELVEIMQILFPDKCSFEK